MGFDKCLHLQVAARFMLDFAHLFPRNELERYHQEMASFEIPRGSVKLVRLNLDDVFFFLLPPHLLSFFDLFFLSAPGYTIVNRQCVCYSGQHK